MHPDLGEPLKVVLGDLARTGLHPERITYNPDFSPEPPAQVAAALYNIDGHGWGVTAILGADWNERLVTVADQVQEFALEGLLWQQGLPATWPQCPHHPDSHPLQPVAVDGAAPMWCCPKDHTPIAPIGQLPAAPAPG